MGPQSSVRAASSIVDVPAIAPERARLKGNEVPGRNEQRPGWRGRNDSAAARTTSRTPERFTRTSLSLDRRFTNVKKPKAKSNRLVPTKGQLRSDSKTLRYELEMLINLPREYESHALQGRITSSNAVIESFAIHQRQLVFFLFGHCGAIATGNDRESFAPARRRDILACDFHPAWANECPKPTDLMIRSKRQADKHVAHIGIDRRELNQPGAPDMSVWQLREIAAEVCNVFAKFLRERAELYTLTRLSLRG